MRVLLFTLLLAASGCRKNHEAIHSRQVEFDRRLAEAMLRADNLNETRRELDALDLEVRNGLEASDAARLAVAALALEPAPRSTPPPLPPLPPESLFEGSEGPRLRARLSDTERRLAELGKILGELDRMEAEKRLFQRKLAVIHELKRK